MDIASAPDAGGCHICLATPKAHDGRNFCPGLERLLDLDIVASIRLSLETDDPETLARASEALLRMRADSDVSILVDADCERAIRWGLDGVHLSGGPGGVAEARRHLGKDRVVGAFCGGSRHRAMLAGESGADYVSFGPFGATDSEGAEAIEILAWWREFTVLPCIAEGVITRGNARSLAEHADFLLVGPEIWATGDAEGELRALARELR